MLVFVFEAGCIEIGVLIHFVDVEGYVRRIGLSVIDLDSTIGPCLVCACLSMELLVWVAVVVWLKRRIWRRKGGEEKRKKGVHYIGIEAAFR